MPPRHEASHYPDLQLQLLIELIAPYPLHPHRDIDQNLGEKEILLR
jgi:hypothetical protein